MFWRILAFVPLLMLALSWNVEAQKDDAAKRDLMMLQGVWTAEVGKESFTITGKKYVQMKKGKIVEEGTFSLDPSTTPARIDFEILSAGSDKGKFQHGIYELVDGTWKISAARPGAKGRPKTFEGNFYDAVLKQKKKK